MGANLLISKAKFVFQELFDISELLFLQTCEID